LFGGQLPDNLIGIFAKPGGMTHYVITKFLFSFEQHNDKTMERRPANSGFGTIRADGRLSRQLSLAVLWFGVTKS
jgi:hypothetical protein